LKQPDALPGQAPQKNKNYIFLNYFWFICDFFINDFYFLEFFLKNFFWGVLHQAVRAVSKNRPKYPKLDIPFQRNLLATLKISLDQKTWHPRKKS
jgi:hypothetical protein